MEALQVLNEKIDLMLKKYAELKSENKSLKDIIAQQTKSIAELTQKQHEMEQQVLSKHIGLLDLPEADKEKMRKQLDTVIGEIDKILNTIND